jgi:hypothetical protein
MLYFLFVVGSFADLLGGGEVQFSGCKFIPGNSPIVGGIYKNNDNSSLVYRDCNFYGLVASTSFGSGLLYNSGSESPQDITVVNVNISNIISMFLYYFFIICFFFLAGVNDVFGGLFCFNASSGSTFTLQVLIIFLGHFVIVIWI